MKLLHYKQIILGMTQIEPTLPITVYNVTDYLYHGKN
jgi:hypothetical protein